MRVAAERLVGSLFGAAPWPAAGGAGRVAAACMAIVALVFVGAALERRLTWPPRPSLEQTDFLAYYSGTHLLLRGEGARLFDPARQWEAQRELMPDAVVLDEGPIAYMNPPLWAAALALLYPLGVIGAAWAWQVLSLAAVGVVLVATAAAAGGTTAPRVCVRAALHVLTFFSFVQFWHYGNMGAVLVLALGGWLVATRAGRDILAGLALSVLLLKPQYAPFALLALVGTRRWRQVGAFMVGGLVQAILSAAIYWRAGGLPPGEAISQYLAFNVAESDRFSQGQVSLRAAVRLLAPDLSPALEMAAYAVVAAALSGVVLLVLSRARPDDPSALAWQALVVGAMCNLTAAHNQLSGLVLLMPGAAALLATARQGGASRPIATLALLLALPSLGILLVAVSPWLYVLTGWVVAVGTLLLGLAALWGGPLLRAASLGLPSTRRSAAVSARPPV